MWSVLAIIRSGNIQYLARGTAAILISAHESFNWMLVFFFSPLHIYGFKLCSTSLCCQAAKISLGAITPPSVATVPVSQCSFKINDLQLFCLLFVPSVWAHSERFMVIRGMPQRSPIRKMCHAKMLLCLYRHKCHKVREEKGCSLKAIQANFWNFNPGHWCFCVLNQIFPVFTFLVLHSHATFTAWVGQRLKGSHSHIQWLA